MNSSPFSPSLKEKNTLRKLEKKTYLAPLKNNAKSLLSLM